MKNFKTFTELKKLKDQYKKTFKSIVQGQDHVKNIKKMKKIKEKIVEAEQQISKFQLESGLPVKKSRCQGTFQPMMKAKKQFTEVMESLFSGKIKIQENKDCPLKDLIDQLVKQNYECEKKFQQYSDSLVKNVQYEPKIIWKQDEVRLINKGETYWGALNKDKIFYVSPKNQK